jgi:hypothetical protein
MRNLKEFCHDYAKGLHSCNHAFAFGTSIPTKFINIPCFRKTGESHIFPKPHKYAIIESKKVLKKQHLKGEEKWGKSK